MENSIRRRTERQTYIVRYRCAFHNEAACRVLANDALEARFIVALECDLKLRDILAVTPAYTGIMLRKAA